MKAQKLFYLLVFLLIATCGKSKSLGLSDKELFAQKDTLDTKQKSKQETVSRNLYCFEIASGFALAMT